MKFKEKKEEINLNLKVLPKEKPVFKWKFYQKSLSFQKKGFVWK